MEPWSKAGWHAHPRWVCLACLLIATFAALLGPPPAAAASPWFHLGQVSRPANLAPGRASNEVQQVTVSATGGSFALLDEQRSAYRIFAWNATAAKAQAGLQELFGSGNVLVSGGPGDEAGSAPYIITFVGALADQPIPPLKAVSLLDCEGAANPSICQAEATLTELAAGRADGELVIAAVNLGDASAGGSASPLTLRDLLPVGLTPKYVSGISGLSESQSDGPVECSIEAQHTVICAFAGSLPAFDAIEIRIGVTIDTGAQALSPNQISVSGGGSPPATSEHSLTLGPPAAPFGIEEFGLTPEQEGGAVTTQAGGHPYQVTTAFSLKQTADALPIALPKDVRIDLPQGLIADTQALPRCATSQFFADECPPDTAVGVGSFVLNAGEPLGLTRRVGPIFNVEPAPGEPARFGLAPLNFSGHFPVFINAALRSDEHYAARLSIPNVTQGVGFLGATITLWGTPWDRRHDDARGSQCLLAARGEGGASCHPLEAISPRSFLTMPTSCRDSAPQSRVEVTPWSDRNDHVSANDAFPAIGGCNQVPFSPKITAEATSDAASSPSGFKLSLEADDAGLLSQAGLAPSPLKRLALSLPEGFTLNPSAAAGLAACQRSQFEAESLAVGSENGCPDAAKLGTARIESALFAAPLTGAVFLADPETAKFHGILGLYLLARDPSAGLLVKLSGELRLDPNSGRISIDFDQLPELPLSRLQLSFAQGPRGLLATPSSCGAFAIETKATGYANPDLALDLTSPTTISAGPDSARCPDLAQPAFRPQFIAGTLDNAAGRYSPLTIRITRNDGESELSRFSLTLPPGVSAHLADIPSCPQSALAAAAGRTAAEEQAQPSCPAAAKIGRTLIGAGVGPLPSYISGSLYLSGPYHGAPFSIAALIPVRLGPLDLGTVVFRFPIAVDPRTAQLSIASAVPLPSILDGVVLHLRDLRLYLDRPGFVRNPTTCEPTALTGTALASDGATAVLRDRFQAADCSALPFKPRLALHLSAGARNAHPAIRATVRSGQSEAGILSAAFTLPPGELLDLHRLRALCPRSAAPAQCHPDSRLGSARLSTPLADTPLEGPIFLREPISGLPDLVANLDGGGLHIILSGNTTASHGRVGIDFQQLPDLPLSKAVISIAGGSHGIIANSRDLCTHSRHAVASLRAHSGKRRLLKSRIQLSGRC